jgi:hypothetical protein
MAQSNYTPIQLYRTSTAAAAPSAGNLADGELAINLTDEALYFKNAAGVVKLLADSSGALGSVTSVDVSGGTTGLTTSGGPITSSGTITLAGTLAVANGGTGVTTSTGTGSVVLSNSPTLVTPVLGAASATSIANGLGAVGTPSYTFTGDTNTGIYSPAADTLAFVEGGVEAMRIDSSGNVGIGTSSPTFKLVAANNTFDGVGLGSSSTYSFVTIGGYFSSTAGAAQIGYERTNGAFVFGNGTRDVPTERMRIDNSGNVGIGTSSPTNISGYKTCTLNGTDGSWSEYRQNEDYVFRIGSDSSTGGFLYHQGAFPIRFFTNNAERFRILSTGGITSSDLADAVGYKGLPQNSQTSSYTLALSDMGKHISITTGGVVIPANGSVAFPIGASIVVFNNSGSNQTISITTDTLRQAGTANTGSRTLAQYGLATLVKVTSTVWVVSGAGIS